MSPAERLRREAHRLHRREPGALEALLELAEELEGASPEPIPGATLPPREHFAAQAGPRPHPDGCPLEAL
jgi:hypothetical protein